jgi:hypothetical protein
VIKMVLRRPTRKKPPLAEDLKLNAKGMKLAGELMKNNGISMEEAARWVRAHGKRCMSECDDFRGE